MDYLNQQQEVNYNNPKNRFLFCCCKSYEVDKGWGCGCCGCRAFPFSCGICLFSVVYLISSIKDLVDIIRRNYNIKTKESIIKIINDYKKFKPVIFYSLYEHNSNSLSWRETQCEIVLIEGDYSQFYKNLENKLKQYKDNYIKIGSFTAASNITGLLLDVDKIAA